MGEIHAEQIFPFLILLFFPLIGGIFSSYVLKSSPLLGYIIGGILLNQIAIRFFDTEILLKASNLGIILLLFTIGLEVRLSELKRFGKLLLNLGLIQILGSFLFFLFIFLLLGFSFPTASILSASFCISSTAVVAKLLQESGEENSLVGGLSLGILIMQDIALIPLLILEESLGNGGGLVFVKTLLIEISKAITILFFVYLFSTKAISHIFDFFAKLPREILNLFTIFFGTVVLYVLSLMGISPLLSAFITGVMIAQTIEHQHIFSEIRPFRDFFAIIFFTVLGLSFPFDTFISVFHKSLLLALFIMISKIILILLIGLILGLHTKTAFSLSLNLFQVGEGAFVILQQGYGSKVLSDEVYFTSLGAVILLLIFTPLLFREKDKIYFSIRYFLRKYFKNLYDFISLKFDREPPRIDALELRNHIVICGYGRVGSYIGRALELIGVPFIAVDYDFRTVEKAKKRGVNIVYGDPANPDVLDYLQVDKAKILIIAVPDKTSQEEILVNALNLNPNIRIFTRVHRERDMHRLKELGAHIIVHPEFEASLSIVRKILILQGLSKEEIKNKLQRLKIEHWLGVEH